MRNARICGVPGHPPIAMLLGQLAHPAAWITSRRRNAIVKAMSRKRQGPAVPRPTPTLDRPVAVRFTRGVL
jgi:hypothetical protein